MKLKEVLAGTRAARRATRKDSGSAAADGQNGDAGRNGVGDSSADLDR
ncbi:MAG: hypothetical protein IPN03_03050 [Holophagales bacterium]|nr:hypothetical protein [Holophagales bacterium]